jgi:hypothetical protein
MQTSVNFAQPLGIPGEFVIDGPVASRPFTLVSSDPTNNVFGRAFTVSSEGVAQAGGTGVFAGILTSPKEHVSFGTSAGGSLAPTLALPNNTRAELTTLAVGLLIAISAACNIGDLVVFDQTTGALSTVAVGSSTPGTGKSFVPNAVISDYTPSAAGIAVMRMVSGA